MKTHKGPWSPRPDYSRLLKSLRGTVIQIGYPFWSSSPILK